MFSSEYADELFSDISWNNSTNANFSKFIDSKSPWSSCSFLYDVFASPSNFPKASRLSASLICKPKVKHELLEDAYVFLQETQLEDSVD